MVDTWLRSSTVSKICLTPHRTMCGGLHPMWYVLYVRSRMHHNKGEVMSYHSYVLDATKGWVVGHSYIVYAPLATGCTTVLFEGKPVGTPDPGTFWRVAEQHKVSGLFAAPTAFRAIRK